MAVGTVSSISDDVWQLISTTTMAGATTYTFSGIAGYKRLMVAITNGVKSGGDYYTVRFNGDTTAGKYSGGNNGGGDTFHYIGNGLSTSSAALVIVEDANQSAPHKLYIGGYIGTIEATAGYVDDTPITSITIGCNGSSTLTSGTIKLFGIAA
jgi:hypothetical protein